MAVVSARLTGGSYLPFLSRVTRVTDDPLPCHFPSFLQESEKRSLPYKHRTVDFLDIARITAVSGCE